MDPSIGRTLSILHRQAQLYITHQLRPLNLSLSEYAFILLLRHQPGITQDEMSDYLYIDKAATARAVASLIRKGFALKKKDDSDKRCNHIYLSAQGQALYPLVLDTVQNWNHLITQDLSPDQVTQLHQQLVSMAERGSSAISVIKRKEARPNAQ